MDKNRIVEIVKDVENVSNRDLFSAINVLNDEFEKTKTLIIELTRHLDLVEQHYTLINGEIEKRTKK
jgi:hypothetical protein